MGNENVQSYLEALRSGRYEQAQGSLREGNRFCCLGVACDVYRELTGKGAGDTDVFVSDTGGDTNYMPPEVMKFYGFRNRRGEYDVSGPNVPHKRKLADDDNDEDRKSFSEIADIIEQAPPGLFV